MSANQGWLPELGLVSVATPCPSDWEQMQGDGQVRFCGACKLNVYNLSELTADEARQLLNSSEERMCVRFWVRRDGRLLTRDCPVGLAARAKRKIAATIASIAALFAGWGIFGVGETISGPQPAVQIPGLERVGAGYPARPDGPIVGLDYADERRRYNLLSRDRVIQGGLWRPVQVIRNSSAK